MKHTNLIPVAASRQSAAHSPNSDRPRFSRRRRVGLAALLLVTSALLASAQNYALDWYSMDGGGGSSTGGVYAVQGTIGQPDTGQLSGGQYTLSGGFWSIVAAIQTPGAPLLSVTRSNRIVVVSWPAPADGWLLHATTNLAATPISWTEIVPPYQTHGTNLTFTELSPVGNKFYRLHKP